MPEPKLYHLTTTTGHARWSERSEVSDAAMHVITQLIDEMLRHPGQTVDLPGPPGYVASGERDEGRLMATISRHGTAGPLVTVLCVAGAEPRVEATLEPALLFDPAAAKWLGDFERCLGWAWQAWVVA